MKFIEKLQVPIILAKMAELADFFLRPPNFKACSNFDTLWHTDPILPVWKDLNPFPVYEELMSQASLILKEDFTSQIDLIYIGPLI